MNDLDPDVVVKLNRLEWEALPKDFRHQPWAWLAAWDGYHPERKADYGVTKTANTARWAAKR